MKNKWIFILLVVFIGCKTENETRTEKRVCIEALKQMIFLNEQAYNKIIQIYECSSKNEEYTALMKDTWEVYKLREGVFKDLNQNFETGNREEYENFYNNLNLLGLKHGTISEQIEIKNFSTLVLCIHISTVESKILNNLLTKMHCRNEM